MGRHMVHHCRVRTQRSGGACRLQHSTSPPLWPRSSSRRGLLGCSSLPPSHTSNHRRGTSRSLCVSVQGHPRPLILELTLSLLLVWMMGRLEGGVEMPSSAVVFCSKPKKTFALKISPSLFSSHSRGARPQPTLSPPVPSRKTWPSASPPTFLFPQLGGGPQVNTLRAAVLSPPSIRQLCFSQVLLAVGY